MNTGNHQVNKMDRQEFASALQKGLGRAYLYVKRYGLSEVSDLVLSACLHNQAYDAQCEGNKSGWLFSMFKDTVYYEDFRSNILNSLETETDTWDLKQLIDITKEIALNGDAYAVNCVRKCALKIAQSPSVHDWLGAEEWMEIGGIEAMLELVRIYGERLLADTEGNVPGSEIFPDCSISKEYREVLIEYSEKEPSVKAYLQYLEKKQSLLGPVSNIKILKADNFKEASQRPREHGYRESEVNSIIELAKNKKYEYPGRYFSFGRFASKEELDTIYSYFLAEKDDDIRLRLLWVFTGGQAPFIDGSLFELANGNNEHLRWTAIRVLSHLSDSRIHELAVSKLKTKQITGIDNDALDLFINNYTGEDADLIAITLLPMNPEYVDAFSLARSIIKIAENNHDVALVDILKWAYEVTPCSHCRNRVITIMDSLNYFNGEILYECQFDSNEDISELAKKKLVPPA